MPTPEQILADLGFIANTRILFAILWHAALGVFAVALLVGYAPKARPAAVFLSLPIASASLFAWLHANPFNGFVLAAVAVALIAVGLQLRSGPIGFGPFWARILGVLLFGFAWVYPHFLESGGLHYLYAAPLGLLPCPSLSAAVGLALVMGGLGSRLWSWLLAAAGLFYGFFGFFRLGVHIDAALIAGSLALVVQGLQPVALDPTVAPPRRAA